MSRSLPDAPWKKPACRGQRLSWRENDEAVRLRTSRPVVCVDRMRHWFETDEIGLRRRRIENINLERRVGFNIERQFAIKPKDVPAALSSAKGVGDPPPRE